MKKEFKIDNTKLKENMGNFAKAVGKATKEFAETAVLAADQNDDGKFDFEDVSAIAENVGEGVKKVFSLQKQVLKKRINYLNRKHCSQFSQKHWMTQTSR